MNDNKNKSSNQLFPYSCSPQKPYYLLFVDTEVRQNVSVWLFQFFIESCDKNVTEKVYLGTMLLLEILFQGMIKEIPTWMQYKLIYKYMYP